MQYMKKQLLLSAIASITASLLFAQGNLLPASINFERTVVQQTNGEDGKKTITYYFTINGDYAMAKAAATADDDASTLLYTKEGQMCIINEKEKTITIMNMVKGLTDAGAAVKKEMDKKLLPPKDPEEKMTVKKTGKTKILFGYTAYEYEVASDGGKSIWWYAAVDFNPIKIYTMGIGSSPIKISEELKDNPFAVAASNKNYLMAEIEVAGKKGMEIKSISKENFVFSTAGYTIKELKGFK